MQISVDIWAPRDEVLGDDPKESSAVYLFRAKLGAKRRERSDFIISSREAPAQSANRAWS